MQIPVFVASGSSLSQFPGNLCQHSSQPPDVTPDDGDDTTPNNVISGAAQATCVVDFAVWGATNESPTWKEKPVRQASAHYDATTHTVEVALRLTNHAASPQQFKALFACPTTGDGAVVCVGTRCHIEGAVDSVAQVLKNGDAERLAAAARLSTSHSSALEGEAEGSSLSRSTEA